MSARMVRVSGAAALGGVGALLERVPYASEDPTILKASTILPLMALVLVPIVAGRQDDGLVTTLAEGAFDGIAASLGHMAGATLATPF